MTKTTQGGSGQDAEYVPRPPPQIMRLIRHPARLARDEASAAGAVGAGGSPGLCREPLSRERHPQGHGCAHDRGWSMLPGLVNVCLGNLEREGGQSDTLGSPGYNSLDNMKCP